MTPDESLMRLAMEALLDLGACDDSECREQNCNHALVALRARLKEEDGDTVAGLSGFGQSGDVCPACEADRERWPLLRARLGKPEKVRAEKAEAERDDAKRSLDLWRDGAIAAAETLKRERTEARVVVERLEKHDKEMADWLESKACALALALGLPPDQQRPPMDRMIARVETMTLILAAQRILKKALAAEEVPDDKTKG